jgi:hypothetical protein
MTNRETLAAIGPALAIAVSLGACVADMWNM